MFVFFLVGSLSGLWQEAYDIMTRPVYSRRILEGNLVPILRIILSSLKAEERRSRIVASNVSAMEMIIVNQKHHSH